jgi:hypothetical protein
MPSLKRTMVDVPEPFDILLGRGKPTQKHPGNRLLRLLIDINWHRYNKSPRQEKRAIANEIVQGIKSNHGKLPGRFLRPCESGREQEDDPAGWTEVSDSIAIDKVSHCFRARRHLARAAEISSSAGGRGKFLEESQISAEANNHSHHEDESLMMVWTRDLP